MLFLISFRNVSKIYEDTDTKALRNFNLNIETGEFVFIVGSSGAGKSTLLKLMMREEIPTTGEININGYDLNSMKDRKVPFFRRTLGIVFQDFRLIPNMTVFDNVAFAMRVIGAKEKEIRKRILNTDFLQNENCIKLPLQRRIYTLLGDEAICSNSLPNYFYRRIIIK